MAWGNREPLGRFGAGVSALLVHLVLIGLLVLSFRWSTLDTSYVLKSNTHVIHAFMVGPLPAHRPPKPLPPAPPAPPKPVVIPKPQPKPVPKPVVPKGPSAATLAKARAQAQHLAHQKALEEARARAQALAKAKAQAKAQAKARAQLAARQAAAKRAQALAHLKAEEKQAAVKARAELARQIAASAKRAAQKAAAQAAAQKAALAAARGVVDRYKALIQARVSAAWVPVPGASGLRCDVSVRVIAGGQVVSARIVQSSGNAVFDRSVVAAIYNAAPLPVPKSAAKLQYLNPFTFVFKAPKGSTP